MLNAVAGQVPLIGHTLTENVHQLQRASLIGLIVGLVRLIWGASGLAQAGLFTMEQVWNLPGPARPGYVQRLGRAGLFLCLLGGGVIVPPRWPASPPTCTMVSRSRSRSRW